MAKSLSGWQGYPNVCHVCGERIYLSGKKAKGAVFGIETSRHPECRPKERWGALPLVEPETSEARPKS